MSDLHAPTPRTSKTKTSDQQSNLKGTFVSVMLLGVFLIAVWVGIFVLYTVRL